MRTRAKVKEDLRTETTTINSSNEEERYHKPKNGKEDLRAETKETDTKEQ